MPQLMPLNWCMSFFMTSLLFITMMLVYYNGFENFNDHCLQIRDNYIIDWKW